MEVISRTPETPPNDPQTQLLKLGNVRYQSTRIPKYHSMLVLNCSERKYPARAGQRASHYLDPPVASETDPAFTAWL